MLTQAQKNILEGYVNNNDPVNYYKTLKSYGVAYAALALGVASNGNSTSAIADIGGLYAINYLKEKYLQYNGSPLTEAQLLGIKISLMNADFELRKNSDTPLNAGDIAQYHYKVFRELNIPEVAWTGDTIHRRINDASWCIVCSAEEIGTDNVEAYSRVSNLIRDLSNKFSAEDWNIFIQDAFFGKVILNTILDYGKNNLSDTVSSLVLSPLLSLLPSEIFIYYQSITESPLSWAQGFSIGVLSAIDPQISVENAKKLIDSCANSYFFNKETIACLNLIQQQLPSVCIEEFTAENFVDKILSFIKYVKLNNLHGRIISIADLENLDILAKDSGLIRSMLVNGNVFGIQWDAEQTTQIYPNYMD